MFCYSVAAARKVVARHRWIGAEDVTAENLGVWWEVEVSSLDFHSRRCTIAGLSTSL